MGKQLNEVVELAMYVPTDSDRASNAGDVWLLRKYLLSLNSVIERRAYLLAKLHDLVLCQKFGAL